MCGGYYTPRQASVAAVATPKRVAQPIKAEKLTKKVVAKKGRQKFLET